MNRPENADSGEVEAAAGLYSNPDSNGSDPAELSPIRFTEMTATSGVDFRHQTGTSSEKPFPAANGSGIAALDYDLDGRYDLYFACGTPFPPDPARQEPIDRFYRNQGDWKFAEETGPSGLGHNGYSAGVAVGDYNSDGFADLYVTCYGKNCLYRNQGDGTFVDVSTTTAVGDDRWATSAVFFDADADGLLDLYVCNYGIWSLETNAYCGDRVRGIRIYCSPKTVQPQRDAFFRNSGTELFEESLETAGLGGPPGRGQGVIAADINDDGRIDLYLGNDGDANFLFFNEGGGRFRNVTERSGVAYDRGGMAQAGMGVDAADVNGDGRTDLFVTNYEKEHNAFYENQGQGFFSDVSDTKGLDAISQPWVGWGTVFEDFDLDGRVDLVVTNGHTDDNFHELGRDSQYAQPPLVCRNVDGRFQRLDSGVGKYFSSNHVGRALAIADLDNDGDTDMVIGHQDDAPALLRNDRISGHTSLPASLGLRLIGTRSNRDAVGTRITVKSPVRETSFQVKGGGSYLSAHDIRKRIAVLPDEKSVRLEIQWPAGNRSVLSDLQPGTNYVIIEPSEPTNSPRVFHDLVFP